VADFLPCVGKEHPLGMSDIIRVHDNANLMNMRRLLKSIDCVLQDGMTIFEREQLLGSVAPDACSNASC
jgi:hypothetical protein